MESFNIKFVGEVEKHPELYNYSLPEYSKKNVTRRAWAMVAKEVNLSVAECKEKWRNLRSTFVKNLKPKPSGTSTKKPYYLMDAMSFAINFVKVAGSPLGNLPGTSQPGPYITSTLETEQEDFQAEDIIFEPEISGTTDQSPTTTATPHVHFLSQVSRASSPRLSEGVPSPDFLETGTRGPHGQPVRRRKLLSVVENDTDKEFTEYFAAKRTKVSNHATPKNESEKREKGIKSFLNSLVPDLMVMNDIELRKYKRKALLLIDEVMGTSSELLKD